MLDYASPSRKKSPLWPAMLVALLGTPLGCASAGVLGCAGLVGWPLSTINFVESASFGAVVGVIGGILVAAVARACGSAALPISIVGAVVLSFGCAVFILSIPMA